MEEIFDPLRKKNVRLTPEENVRQWFIRVLNGNAGVPMTHMMSEVALNIGKKKMRADIIVYDRKLQSACIVECKEPSVKLDGEVLAQALRYNMASEVPYICITNGTKTFFYRKTGDGSYASLNHLPSFEEMAGGTEN